jgi:hypothetical protein
VRCDISAMRACGHHVVNGPSRSSTERILRSCESSTVRIRRHAIPASDIGEQVSRPITRLATVETAGTDPAILDERERIGHPGERCAIPRCAERD